MHGTAEVTLILLTDLCNTGRRREGGWVGRRERETERETEREREKGREGEKIIYTSENNTHIHTCTCGIF